jgi:hypothetical protein
MTTEPRPSKLDCVGPVIADLSVPRDGRLISLILASKGIEDADERVIHQLLDFSYRKLRGPFLDSKLIARLYIRCPRISSITSGPRGTRRKRGTEDRKGGYRARYTNAKAIRVLRSTSPRCKLNSTCLAQS